ncbi:VOC family protein [Agromyces sp. C10]|uniref:VOC family protein n=1 Tax=Agromyces sp. C10 TaxID=2935077 RepID=UPI00200B8D84|nr:VOC family protein [Agromyces sp. C10]MCK8607940.1 VOC family protein [Agromyces sp. C10]
MPGSEDLVAGSPAWVDVSTTDLDATLAFYGELFGWEAERGDEERYGGYVTFRRDGKRVAGAARRQDTDPAPPHWTVYLLTYNAAATTRTIGEAGGTVLFEPMDIPDMGVMGLAIDATGAVVGYWQPGNLAGFESFGEDDTAVWFELAASDFDAAERFYGHAFHWEVEHGDGQPRSAVYRHGGRNHAGILDAGNLLDEDLPPAWSVAFGVADVEAAVERAVAAGATLVVPPWDLPSGRRAGLADPTGAYFVIASRIPPAPAAE